MFWCQRTLVSTFSWRELNRFPRQSSSLDFSVGRCMAQAYNPGKLTYVAMQRKKYYPNECSGNAWCKLPNMRTMRFFFLRDLTVYPLWSKPYLSKTAAVRHTCLCFVRLSGLFVDATRFSAYHKRKSTCARSWCASYGSYKEQLCVTLDSTK